MLKISFLLAALAIVAHGGVPPRLKGDPCPDGDGFYSIGCFNQYIRCVNGEEFLQECPPGYFFDRMGSICKSRRQDVESCHNNYLMERYTRQKAFSVDCVNREDGAHSFGSDTCFTKFYDCSNGVGTVQRCRFGAYYVAHLNQCASLEICNGYIENVKDSDVLDQASDIPKVRSITKTEVEKPDNELDCATFEGMILSQNLCEPHFWQCTNGKLLKKTCPEGLKYDIENHHCNYPEKMNGCKTCEKISEDVATTNMDEAVEQPAPMEESAGATEPTPEPSTPTYSMNEEKTKGFKCHDKGDGFYDMGSCLKKFASCINGHLRIIKCNDGLVYDGRINSCVYPDACKVDRKSGGEVFKKKNRMDVEVKSVEEMVDSVIEGMTTSKQMCESDIWQCTNGKLVRKSCPEGLVYDHEHHNCNFPEKVKGCKRNNGVSEDFTTTNMDEAVEQPAAVEQSVGAPVPISESSEPTYSMDEEKSIDCHDKSDGLYDLGNCQETFAVCSGGIFRLMYCPSGMVYDARIQVCDYPDACKDEWKYY